jgi:hypothetical protein
MYLRTQRPYKVVFSTRKIIKRLKIRGGEQEEEEEASKTAF